MYVYLCGGQPHNHITAAKPEKRQQQATDDV